MFRITDLVKYELLIVLFFINTAVYSRLGLAHIEIKSHVLDQLRAEIRPWLVARNRRYWDLN